VRTMRAIGAVALAACVVVTFGQSPSTATRRRVAKTTKRPAVSAPKSPDRPTSTTGPTVGGCPVFPDTNPWNTDIAASAMHPQSSTWVASVNASRSTLHPDVGSNPDYGIPYVVVPSNAPPVAIRYTEYGEESDAGPFPIPPEAPVEGGSDRHVIVVQSLRPQVKRAATGGLDIGRCGWSANPSGTVALRRSGVRRDSPRTSLHRRKNPARVRFACSTPSGSS
jgi:hypothetical protein